MRHDRDITSDEEPIDEVVQEVGAEPTHRSANRIEFRSDAASRKKRTTYGRRGAAPQGFNGIHRRRRKRIQW